MIDPQILGDIIAEARKRSVPRVSQGDLAGYLGRDQSFISRIETAEADIKLLDVWKIAEILKADPFDWLYMSDPAYLSGVTEFAEPDSVRLVSVSELAIPEEGNG